MINNLTTARRVIEATKFGGKTIKWSKLSEPERMMVRDALIKANYWGGDKYPPGTSLTMEISTAKQSDINWKEIFVEVPND